MLNEYRLVGRLSVYLRDKSAFFISGSVFQKKSGAELLIFSQIKSKM